MGVTYEPMQVQVKDGQEEKIKHNLKRNENLLKITILPSSTKNSHILLLTPKQKEKIDQARKNHRKQLTLQFSLKQVRENAAHHGGFLAALAALAARLLPKVLPVLLGGLASGALSGGIEKLISGKGLSNNHELNISDYPDLISPVGDGLFFYKHGSCISVKTIENNPDKLILSPSNHIFKEDKY